MTDPIRPTDAEARALARDLMQEARFAALATLTEGGAPMVTRVSFGLAPGGTPISLISTLSAHTAALMRSPACSLLIGEPGPRGDPLTHPRLTLQAQAAFIAPGSDAYDEMAAHYLRDHPKSRLYIGFADFRFACFAPTEGFLNGGFGKAYRLTASDLPPCEPG